MMERFAHGGNIYSSPPAGGWSDFSANISPLGLPDSVRKVIAENISGVVNYPDPAGRELKRAISSFYDVPEDEIVLGNGGSELLYVLMHARKPRRALIPAPSFSEYERAAISSGARIVHVLSKEEDLFRTDIDAILRVAAEGDVVFLGSPNNPTGTLLTADDVRAVAKSASLVVVDESFMDFRDDAARYTARHLPSELENVVVIQSMTKFYALPGLRLGFSLSSPRLARKMEAAKDPWNVNLLAQAAGVAALSDSGYQRRVRELVMREKDALFAALSGLYDLFAFPPTVNFILIRLGASWGTAAELSERMRQRGILIRDCSNYPGLDGSFIRTAVKTRAENERLTRALSDCHEGS